MTTKNRPIIFSADSVRAILDGRKTQTRRVMKPQPIGNLQYVGSMWFEKEYRLHTLERLDYDGTMEKYFSIKCPFGAPGDRLWVREKWGVTVDCETIYFADFIPNVHDVSIFRWRSPMFMLRKYSRLTLEITNVRCERVQEISYDDCLAEGCPYSRKHENDMTNADKINRIGWYQGQWNELNAKRGYGWDTNPWVFVIEFKKIEGGDND